MTFVKKTMVKVTIRLPRGFVEDIDATGYTHSKFIRKAVKHFLDEYYPMEK